MRSVYQAVIMEVIPDIPEEREIQLKRTQFLVDKIVDQVCVLCTIYCNTMATNQRDGQSRVMWLLLFSNS